jgi:hypothetical protein
MRRPVAAVAVFAVVLVVVLAGCGLAACGLAPKGPVRDPNARPPSPSGVGNPSVSRRPVVTPPVRTPATSATGFSGQVAVGCNGKPSGEQVISLLRRRGVLTAQSRATVTTGPLCSGTWQYTVVSVPGADPIAVVSRGAPNALTLITAGGNPCTAKVQVEAPEGIRSALHCDT